jgi:peptidyl-prolyl cis-trans isomerase C
MEKRRKNLVKVVSISALALLVGAFALNGWALNANSDRNGVLATVEGIKITQKAVDERITVMLGSQAGMLSPEELVEVRQHLGQGVLEDLIVETLLVKAVEKENVTVSDSDIAEAMGRLKGSLPPDMTLEDYLTRIGMSENELRQTLKKNLGIQKLVEQKLAPLYLPGDADVEAYYTENQDEFEMPESVEVRHILIAVDPEDTVEIKAEKREKAEEIREQLAASDGKAFEKIASEVSDCPSKKAGGKLGSLTRGQVVKPFEDAAFTRKVGDIGPVVETRFGYHVIEVTDHRGAGMAPLSDVKDRIANQLLEQKKEEALDAYIDSLKAAATIQTPEDASTASGPA